MLSEHNLPLVSFFLSFFQTLTKNASSSRCLKQYQPNLVTRTTDRSFTKVAYQIGVKGHVGLTKVNDLFFQILTKNASSSRFLMQYQPNLVTRTTDRSFTKVAYQIGVKGHVGLTKVNDLFFQILTKNASSSRFLMQYQPNLVTRTTDRSFTKVAYQIGVKGHVGLTKVNDLFFQILTKNASSSRFLMQYQPNLVTRTTDRSFTKVAYQIGVKGHVGLTKVNDLFFQILTKNASSSRFLMQYQPNLVTRTTDRSFTKVAYQIGVKGHVGLTKVNDLFFQILTKNASSSRFLMQYQPNLVTRTTDPSFIQGAFCQRSKVTWGSKRSKPYTSSKVYRPGYQNVAN